LISLLPSRQSPPCTTLITLACLPDFRDCHVPAFWGAAPTPPKSSLLSRTRFLCRRRPDLRCGCDPEVLASLPRFLRTSAMMAVIIPTRTFRSRHLDLSTAVFLIVIAPILWSPRPDLRYDCSTDDLAAVLVTCANLPGLMIPVSVKIGTSISPQKLPSDLRQQQRLDL
jgi:hypothetical protein